MQTCANALRQLIWSGFVWTLFQVQVASKSSQTRGVLVWVPCMTLKCVVEDESTT